MTFGKNAIIVFAAAFIVLAPAVALCGSSDASDIECDEARDTIDGFKFGQQPEKNTLTVVVLIILTLILVVVALLMLRLRKKMNDGHY